MRQALLAALPLTGCVHSEQPGCAVRTLDTGAAAYNRLSAVAEDCLEREYADQTAIASCVYDPRDLNWREVLSPCPELGVLHRQFARSGTRRLTPEEKRFGDALVRFLAAKDSFDLANQSLRKAKLNETD